MKHLYQFICLCVIVISSGVWSQNQSLTSDAFIDKLKQNHPLFKKEALSSEVEKMHQQSLLGDQDWNLYSTLGILREQPAFAIAGPEKTDAILWEGGAERKIWNTGSRIQVSAATGYSEIELDPLISSMYGIPNSYYQNTISLIYVHPLLKNSKGFLDQLQFKLKDFDIHFSEVKALENEEDFLTKAYIKFLDWVNLNEQLKITSERVKLNSEELDRIKKKYASNLVDKVDVIRAEDAVRIAKQNHVLVNAKWKALQAELAIMAENEEITNASPVFNLYEMKSMKNLEQSASYLKENSRILNYLKVKLDQLALVQKGFEESKKTALNLIAELNTKSLDDKVAESLRLNKYDVMVGLQFQRPVENRTAKYQIEKTSLQIQQLTSQYEETSLTLLGALNNLYIQLIEMEKVLKLNQEQIESAREKTEEELKLYNYGRGELTFVIQSRDSEEQAKLMYARNATAYHQLFVQYQALLDDIL